MDTSGSDSTTSPPHARTTTPGTPGGHVAGRIVDALGLTGEQLALVEDLERACSDDGRLKLEWSTLRSRPRDQVRDFLFVLDRATPEVAGFLGLYNFGPGMTEVCGMVHPRLRRRGIFSRLLEAASARALENETVKTDGTVARLLVVNRSSSAGRQFALARGAAPDHSEYEMTLAKPVEPQSFHRYDDLVVRPAREEDRAALSRIVTDAFSMGDLGPETVDIGGVTAIEWRGVPVGMIRTGREEGGAWLAGFAIAAEHRGKGFGHQVLAEVVAGLGAEGVTDISLDVATDNDRALNLYLQVGFVQVGATDYFAYDFTPGSTTNATRQQCMMRADTTRA